MSTLRIKQADRARIRAIQLKLLEERRLRLNQDEVFEIMLDQIDDAMARDMKGEIKRFEEFWDKRRGV